MAIIKYPFILVLTYCLFGCILLTNAQPPECSGPRARYIYFVNPGGPIGGNPGPGLPGEIWGLDPTQPLSATNPVRNTIKADSISALTVSPNLQGVGPSPTFYGVKDGPGNDTFVYWDGSKWASTGHHIGHALAGNIGAGGGFIYAFNGLNGQVYRYNGTGHAIYITTVPNYRGAGPFDIIADCDGNFYVLATSGQQYLAQYNSSGALLNSWSLTGVPNTTGGGGFAVINNKVYFDNYGTYYEGTPNGNNIDFVPLYNAIANMPDPTDFASCPLIAINKKRIRPSANPLYYCGTGPAVPLAAVGGTGVFSWSVLSGPATISATSGGTINVTATDSAKILFSYYDTALCGIKGTDTIHVVVPKANLDAGLPKTISGCGHYLDSLEATLTNMTLGVGYNVTWTPAATASTPGPNKLKPYITPTTNTTYTITVRTNSNHGGCSWSDSVHITVQDLREGITDFDYEIDYGCTEDIVNFTNKSTVSNSTFEWHFGDSTAIDTGYNSVHTYTNQNKYNVMLISDNGICIDTAEKEVDIDHPLKAAFTVDNTIFCTNQPVEFNSNITVASQLPAPPSYSWNFGDGKSSTDKNPKHIYSIPGTYKVTLTVTDFVPCTDTATIVLDNFTEPPVIDVGPSELTVCKDEILYLPQGISIRGTSYLWSTGSTEPRIQVTEPGKYYVELYNDCGVSADTTNVTFNDCTIWMADVFSPNGDGLNDVIRFRTKYPEEISNFNFSIYNRKGNRVFNTQNINQGWDGMYNGSPQPIGAYYYMIQFTFLGEDKIQKGDITLVR